MKLLNLPPPETDVKSTIEDFMTRVEHFEGVMIIGLNKDGSQWMQTSTMSGMQKAFLIHFAQSFMMAWFQREQQ